MAAGTGALRGNARALAGALFAVLFAACALAGSAASRSPSALADGSVRVATTGNHSELVKTLPVTNRKGGSERVVMSMKPGRLPGLQSGDRLRFTAEMQVTVNCGFPSPRCVGPVYRYDPIVRARLVLAPDAGTMSGPDALPLTGHEVDACTQRHPHREHHCVLTFNRGGLIIRDPAELPCPLDACYVNMVAGAHNPDARPGEVVLVGGNKPDGSIPQDRGRINAIRYRGVSAPDFEVASTQAVRDDELPPDFKRYVAFSLRLDGLSEGEQLDVDAFIKTAIKQVPYAVRSSARLILSDRPNGTKQGRFVKRIAESNGEISENNGSNCTQDKPYCIAEKVGVLQIKRDAVNGRGNPVPLYVNMVVVYGPKVLSAKAGDRIDILEGEIAVRRFPPEVNR